MAAGQSSLSLKNMADCDLIWTLIRALTSGACMHVHSLVSQCDGGGRTEYTKWGRGGQSMHQICTRPSGHRLKGA